MSIKIALAGNPNSGKTTLFNTLTGSNQFVGNWPGVTVEKKEGKLKSNKDIHIMDLPGIYSLSPYTLEEVVARNYLIDESPDVILNIIDGTNIERNLYLTTQLMDLGIPIVIAINMMDVVKKSGDKIDTARLSKELGCKVIEISALKGTGIEEAANAAIAAANGDKSAKPSYHFSASLETTISEVNSMLSAKVPENQKRFFSIKLLEKDEKIESQIRKYSSPPNIKEIIDRIEDEFDDDAESIITNERYTYISEIIKKCVRKNNKSKYTLSDKIDRVVTNRWLALPIFAVVMIVIYYISVSTVGAWATDWMNDGVFADGWRFFGIGTPQYEEASEKYDLEQAKIEAYLDEAASQGLNTEEVKLALEFDPENIDEESAVVSKEQAQIIINSFVSSAASKNIIANLDLKESDKQIQVLPTDFSAALSYEEPDPSKYGAWIPGIPVIFENLLDKANAAPWLKGLILEGIVGGVGGVLGFVPQILALFLFLAFLESCGYMARIAFIMDRIFRKFGLSGKSFIPVLIGTGCSVPGIMASRTIESDRDRKMTIITTSFMPCGAKLPIIALIAGAMFGGAAWVAPSAYFIGIGAIIISGIILKKTKMFAGDPSPFVMELPSYHMPTLSNVLRSMWERGWSFIKKAGTIILLSSIVIWFFSNYGFTDGKFGMVEDLNNGLLATIGGALAWVFVPLGFGKWQAAVATIMGLVAKENVVGTFGILYGFAEIAEDGVEIWGALAADYTALASFSFLIFNLLCAPCFAAIGAIKREMNSAKWTWFAIGYQTVFAYSISLCVYQLGNLFSGGGFSVWLIAAFAILAAIIYLLFRKGNNSNFSRKLGKNISANV